MSATYRSPEDEARFAARMRAAYAPDGPVPPPAVPTLPPPSDDGAMGRRHPAHVVPMPDHAIAALAPLGFTIEWLHGVRYLVPDNGGDFPGGHRLATGAECALWDALLTALGCEPESTDPATLTTEPTHAG